jgi:hypothetical protein
MNLVKYILTAFMILNMGFCAEGQNQHGNVFVDDMGVMRWGEDSSEIHGFGVNYTLPFAHEFRVAKKSGIPMEELIRQDVYHMARLDVDFYRVHVWDTEISDTAGHLLMNEHLDLLDYTLNEMKKRGIKIILTPLAYWGNGWPDKDEDTPGFSHKYGKGACLTNPAAIKAQEVYLAEFVSHVNPFTGIAYKNDPDILGFEICNEPHHDGPPEKVTAFINTMAGSIRKTGCEKPLFYNMSHSIFLADAYMKAGIQGGTFQWYPANLVSNHQVNGNFLPQVKEYAIPFSAREGFKKMAKIIYEFDPADVGGSIMYPAMALAFRKAGMQLAAQFEYDALCSAAYNTNYGTHYMNLAYAPHKAISLKIASAVFHSVPMYAAYEDVTHFGDFHIDYVTDLAEWVTPEKFFYSNSTTSQPRNPSELKEIAGCGSSPVVTYAGTGAYFLDKLTAGLWRLEVMPDAWWIKDPYGPVDFTRKAAVTWQKHTMNVNLPDLGKAFRIKSFAGSDHIATEARNGQFTIFPGVYLLQGKEKDDVSPETIYKNIRIDEFVAPRANLEKTVVWNNTPSEVVSGIALSVIFNAAAPNPVLKTEIEIATGSGKKVITAVSSDSIGWHGVIPADLVKGDQVTYTVRVITRKDTSAFGYTLHPVSASARLILWDAQKDWEYSYKIWNRSVNVKPFNGGNALAVTLPQLLQEDPIHPADLSYSFRFYFGNKIKGRINELSHKKYICLEASNELTDDQPLLIGLVDEGGSVVATKISVEKGRQVYKIPLTSLQPSFNLVLPRPYPDFLPFKIPSTAKTFDKNAAEMLQLMILPGKQAKTDLHISSVWLE